MGPGTGVITQTKRRVRLRQSNHALEGAIDCEGKGLVRYRLEPERWTEVPEQVYHELKSIYGEPRYTDVPDPDANERNPHSPGDGQTAMRRDVIQEYLIEFGS
jgi:hypothetical protein